MSDVVFKQTKDKMNQAVDAVRREFGKLRAGKAVPALLDGLLVEAYGSTMPLNQVGTIGAPEPRLPCGSKQAQARTPQSLELRDPSDDLLERGEAVADTGGVLETEVLGETPQTGLQWCERVSQVLALEAFERPHHELGAPLAPDRAERPRCRNHRPSLPAPLEIERTIRPRRTDVRRWAKLADEPELLERRLELRAEYAPLDPLERAERRLDGRSLSVAGEVRAQTGAEVAGLADVEHRAAAAAEEVHAGARRRARHERALRVQAARARCAEFEDVGQRPRAALLREPEKCDEDLGGRERIGQCAMARLPRRAEEVRELPKGEALAPAVEEPAGEPDRIQHGRHDPPPGQPRNLAIEEADVEARIVCDERRFAREGEEAPDRDLRPGRAAQLLVTKAGEGRDLERQRDAGVDECRELVDDLESADAGCPDLADEVAGCGETGRLEIEDDELGVLDEGLDRLVACEADPPAKPDEAGVALDDVRKERAGEGLGRALEREQDPRSLLGTHGPTACLDELDEPVGGVEGELHAPQPMRTYVPLQLDRASGRCGTAWRRGLSADRIVSLDRGSRVSEARRPRHPDGGAQRGISRTRRKFRRPRASTVLQRSFDRQEDR